MEWWECSSAQSFSLFLANAQFHCDNDYFFCLNWSYIALIVTTISKRKFSFMRAPLLVVWSFEIGLISIFCSCCDQFLFFVNVAKVSNIEIFQEKSLVLLSLFIWFYRYVGIIIYRKHINSDWGNCPFITSCPHVLFIFLFCLIMKMKQFFQYIFI